MKAGDVILDFNKRSAIVVSIGRTNMLYVPIEDGELVLRSGNIVAMQVEGWLVLPGYPIKRAVRIYLKHSGGVSAKAKAALKELIK